MRYDATGAYRVYRLDKIPQGIFGLVRSRDYSFFYESLKVVDLAKLPIAQVPVVLAPRFEGNSKMRPSDMVRGFTYLFQLGMRSRLPLSSLRRASKLILKSDSA
jgi:dolichol-phosphate mannosyltransferase